MLAVSERGYAFVACREACVLTVYPDTHNPASGFGMNDLTKVVGQTVTMDEAILAFVQEGKRIAAALDRVFAGFDLKQQHVDACFSLAYNIGAGALSRNTGLVGAIKSFCTHPTSRQLRDAAGYQFVRANYSDDAGPFNLSRRCREAILFVSGDYGDLSTLQLWPAGKSPKATPPDPPTLIPMPRFLP